MSQTDPNNDHQTEGSSALKKAASSAGKAATKKAVKTAAKKAAQKAAGTTLLAKIGWPIILGAFLLLLIAGAALIIIFIAASHEESSPQPGGGFWGGDISELAENEIPADFIPIYKAAEQEYGVPWNLLAAIHRVETHFSTIDPMVSPVGAVGHMQFMPCTWLGWGHPSCGGLGAGNIDNSQLVNVSVINKYGGYGVDANGDGKADPFDLEDAIFSAANYLAANGAAEGDFRRAAFAYNRADWYVEKVMGYADSYVSGYVPIGDGGGSGGNDVVNVGKKWIGNSKYVFGGGRNQADIAAGRFDCSSFVHWAFAQVGVDLGPLGSTSTETLKHLGTPVPPNEMKPGDLVFFDTYKIDGHVGIYVGDGKYIGAQSSTGVAIVDMTKGYWAKTFNGRVKRI
ncbi:bifunctional lytic transglycosylase/C40 family peptidase [Shouchella clausii]|nr:MULTISPECIES: bifunctional lytic transglycosylase/C40 family peptidase [Shouchella]ALA55215.1 metalloendopeptidase-like membrane protein [Shouchella clausii]MBU3266255.1 bifunctional lytic transglycosylase/C40 family peptidase [Shouchella clausii]MBU3509348.1 bifunctional lytic transglycosylase/C40 family peptidase [Shouchella clausii]MDP0462068.1 bifunctional lytic transglycosylase/C40 family peptidase [Shouchella rhizosphaerae]MDP5267745.1 bifunctional lytic transglycosylase/C40 family pe